MSDSNYPAQRDAPADSGDQNSKEALEQNLAEREASIQRRIDDLEEEISSTPAAIKASVLDHPFIGVAGAAAAGLAVGFIVTGLSRKKPDVAPFHQRLVEQYFSAIGDDVRDRMRRGRSTEDAVRESMADRAPLVVYAPTRSERRESRGFWSELGDIALKTALGFAVKVALDVAAASVDVEELQEMIAADEPGTASESHGGDGLAGTVDRAADV